MTDYSSVIKKFIETEKENFGPVALEHARKVDGVKVNDDGSLEIANSDQEAILLDLVQEYHRLVGDVVSAALKEEEIDDSDLLANLQQYLGEKPERRI